MSGHPQSRLAQFPFGGGMNQNADPRLLEPPAVVSAKNVRVLKPGSYDKRPGTVSVASSLTDPSWASYSLLGDGSARLSPLGDSFMYADQAYASVYSPAAGTLQFRGYTPLGCPRKRTLYGNTASYSAASATTISEFAMIDCAAGTTAAGQSVVAVAWVSKGIGTFLVLYDAGTWTPINCPNATYGGDPASLLLLYWWPRLMWLGNDLFIVAHANGTDNLTLFKLTTSTWTLASVGNVVTDARNTEPRAWFDVCPMTSTKFALAYQDTGGTVMIRRCTTSATTDYSVTSAEGVVSVDGIGVHATSGENIWVTWARNSGQARATCVNDATQLERASFPMNVTAGASDCWNTGVVRLSSTEAAVFFSRYDGAVPSVTLWSTTITTAAAESAMQQVNSNTVLVGKPVLYAGRVHVPVVWGGVGQPTVLPWVGTGAQWSSGTMQYMTDRSTSFDTAMLPSTTMIPRVATSPRMMWLQGAASENIFAPCSTVLVGTQYVHAWPEIRGVVGDNASRETLELHAYDTQDATHLRGTKLGPCTYMFGSVFDIGFQYDHSPIARFETFTAADAGAGTASDAGGSTFQYRAVLVTTTASGQVIRSAPSNAVSHTAAASQNITVTIGGPPSTRCWARQAYGYQNMHTEVYRTTDGTSGPYYYVGRTDALSPTGAGATYTDSSPDGTIALNPQLYTGDIGTQRSINANVLPPTFVCTVTHKDRLFGLDPNRRRVWFSDKLVSGEVPAFHDEFTIEVDDDIVALASMDSTLVAFSERHVYAMSGDGPSNRFPGSDSDYRGLERIASDAGCIAADSVCLTPDGLVYRSKAGLAVFSRGGQAVPFGLEVQDILDAFPLNTSVVLHPTQRWLYVACDDGATGVRLVYDYRNKMWSFDDVTAGQPAERIAAQLSWNGSVHFIAGSDGSVWRESDSTFLDAGAWVSRIVTLAPFKSAGPQGWQGVTWLYFLGQRHTPHGMTVVVNYDHAASRTESFSFTDTEVSAFENSPTIQWCRALTYRENQSVSVALVDTAPTVGALGTGQGATWIAYALDHELKKEPAPLAAAQQR